MKECHVENSIQKKNQFSSVALSCPTLFFLIVNQIYCDHCTIYTNLKSLHCTHETNIMFAKLIDSKRKIILKQ